MNRSIIILVIIALLILGAAAYMLFGRPADGAGVTASGAPSSQAEMEFITLAAKLDPVTFSTGILDDPRFRALQDITTAIIPEPAGRIDPFAPLNAR